MPVMSVAGRSIHYREAGRGPLVIALHASSSHSGQWKPFMEAVQDRFHVIAPDLHGYGRSDPLPDDGRSFHAHDAGIAEVLIRRDGPAHIVGHSLGGAIGLAVARRSVAVASLTMIEPVLFGLLSEAGHPGGNDPNVVHEFIIRTLREGDLRKAARGFVAFWSGEEAFDAMPPHVQDYVTATIERVAADFAGLLPDSDDPLTIGDAARLTVPVHLICGGETRPSARAIVDLLSSTVPGAVRTDVPGAAHMAAATDPGLIIPHIAAFLDANAS